MLGHVAARQPRSRCTATTTSTASARRRVAGPHAARARRRGARRGCRAGWRTATACRRATVDELHARGARLLITADCGIGAVEEVAHARQLGMDVVVTDHHRPGDELPGLPDRASRRRAAIPAPTCARPASPTSSRRRCSRRPAATRPSSSASSTSSRSPRSPTSCRCVGENRTLVRRGLRALAGHAAPGPARADAGRAASIRRASTSTRSGSRSRRGSTPPGACTAPTPALELLLTEDAERALEIARELDAINTERQSVETAILFEAERLLSERAELARRPALRARRRGLASGRDRDRGLAPGRALSPALRADRARRRGPRPRLGPQHRALRPARRPRRVRRAPDALRRPPDGRRPRDRGGRRSSRSGAHSSTHARVALSTRGPGAGRARRRGRAGRRARARAGRGARAPAAVRHGQPRRQPARARPRGSSDVRPMGEGRHARFTVTSGGVRSRAVAFGVGQARRIGSATATRSGEPTAPRPHRAPGGERVAGRGRAAARAALAAPGRRADRATPPAGRRRLRVPHARAATGGRRGGRAVLAAHDRERGRDTASARRRGRAAHRRRPPRPRAHSASLGDLLSTGESVLVVVRRRLAAPRAVRARARRRALRAPRAAARALAHCAAAASPSSDLRRRRLLC